MTDVERVCKQVEDIQECDDGSYVEHIDWLCDSLLTAVEALDDIVEELECLSKYSSNCNHLLSQAQNALRKIAGGVRE